MNLNTGTKDYISNTSTVTHYHDLYVKKEFMLLYRTFLNFAVYEDQWYGVGY